MCIILLQLPQVAQITDFQTKIHSEIIDEQADGDSIDSEMERKCQQKHDCERNCVDNESRNQYERAFLDGLHGRFINLKQRIEQIGKPQKQKYTRRESDQTLVIRDETCNRCSKQIKDDSGQ